MIGLRHEVGGDWWPYIDQIEFVTGDTLIEAVAKGDPAYYFLNWFGANIFGGIYFVNTISAFFFSWGVVKFCRSMPYPWLALTVSIPYLVIVVGMGYTRQGVAIGFALIGLAELLNGRGLRFTGWILIAALFHKTAIVLLLLSLFTGKARMIFRTLAALALGSVVLYSFFLEAINEFNRIYIEAEYGSSGALIRIAMNSVPALFFLLCTRRFQLDETRRKIWLGYSITGLLFLPLLIISPSAAAVDRLALYWIPIQILVWSRLPIAFGRTSLSRGLCVSAVIGFSSLILFTWLIFAENSFNWVPYRLIPSLQI